jgi:hypothetical protein
VERVQLLAPTELTQPVEIWAQEAQPKPQLKARR